MTGRVTISIDVELAWGNWDNLRQTHIDHIEHSERQILRKLVQLFDHYDIPVTWAFVAALLNPASARKQPASENLWYAPDVIEMICAARVRHDLGSHGGHHKYFHELDSEAAEEELAFARAVHDAYRLPFHSFVYPRNRVAKTELLAKFGVKIYRGEDRSWHQKIRGHSERAGRIAALLDKVIPIAPATVLPERHGKLRNLPGSMLFMGREGIRRMIPEALMQAKLSRGIRSAVERSEVFHLWFHPSNFWHEPEMQFRIFERFLNEVAVARDQEELALSPMANLA